MLSSDVDTYTELSRTCGGEWEQSLLRCGWCKEAAGLNENHALSCCTRDSVARETAEPAVEKNWPNHTDFAEMRGARYSGVSSAKRCLVAGAAAVDLTAALRRA